MTDQPKPTPPIDRVGKLCQMGKDSADYLFQVPDDAAELEKVGKILDAIIADKSMRGRKEGPKIVSEMKEALDGPPSGLVAEQLQVGFDRLTRLWMSARSGLY